ncbi:MAG: hypothetical protein U0T69_07625 [Chitinophagales bacterium]
MRKIYLLCVSLMMLMVACQKEASNATKQAQDKVNVLAGNQSAKDVWVLPSGFEANSFYNNGGVVTSLGDASLYCGGVINEATLHAGNQILGGKVQWANDQTNLYITFFAFPNWYFTEIELYVGKLSKMPHTREGSPSQGRFPFQNDYCYNNLSQNKTYTIPLSSLTKNAAGEWIIAAHAVVVKTEVRGNRHNCSKNWYDDDDDDDDSNDNNLEIVARHSVWGSGVAFFNDNNGCGGQNVARQTYIVGTLTSCDETPPPPPPGVVSNTNN